MLTYIYIASIPNKPIFYFNHIFQTHWIDIRVYNSPFVHAFDGVAVLNVYIMIRNLMYVYILRDRVNSSIYHALKLEIDRYKNFMSTLKDIYTVLCYEV